MAQIVAPKISSAKARLTAEMVAPRMSAIRARPTQIIITGAEFPESLKPGEPITGTITLTSPADGPTNLVAKVTITPKWLTGVSYTSIEKTIENPGESAQFLFPDDFPDVSELKMPPQEATLEIYGVLAIPDGEPVYEETVEVTIAVPFLYKKIGPLQVWQYLAAGGVLIVIVVAASR